jgi:hypothetical protein
MVLARSAFLHVIWIPIGVAKPMIMAVSIKEANASTVILLMSLISLPTPVSSRIACKLTQMAAFNAKILS